MKHLLAVVAVALHTTPAAAGDWGFDALWEPTVVAMGDRAFVVKNVLGYDDPDTIVGPEYLTCAYPKVMVQTTNGLQKAVARGIEFAICPYSSTAPDAVKPREDPEPAKRIESGFARCERIVVYAPATRSEECTPPEDAARAEEKLKGTLAQQGLALGEDIRTYPMKDAPKDLLSRYGYANTSLFTGRVWRNKNGPMCGVQIKGPTSSATLVKASANGSCGGYRAEIAVSPDWLKVVAVVKNYEWTTAAGWKTEDLAAIIKRLEK
ncbi:MAG: hypothetical protein AAFU77_17295 [Myxococcota bacterium]